MRTSAVDLIIVFNTGTLSLLRIAKGMWNVTRWDDRKWRILFDIWWAEGREGMFETKFYFIIQRSSLYFSRLLMKLLHAFDGVNEIGWPFDFLSNNRSIELVCCQIMLCHQTRYSFTAVIHRMMPSHAGGVAFMRSINLRKSGDELKRNPHQLQCLLSWCTCHGCCSSSSLSLPFNSSLSIFYSYF